MNHCLINFACFLSLTVALCAPPTAAQTLAPATQIQFQLPLANAEKASAILLPTPTGHLWLVYATPTGHLGLWTLTPTDPTPPPNPTPPPPLPTKLRIAVVEDPKTTSLAARQVLASPIWKSPQFTKHDILGIVPADLDDHDHAPPPAQLRPYILAAENHGLPCLILADQSDRVLWIGDLPLTTHDLNQIVQKYGG